MAQGKQSFVLYCDLIHTVRKLSDEQSGILFKHILSYVNDENPTPKDMIIELVFEPIKQLLKRDLRKYESIIERNKINGSKGGRPKKPKKPNGLIGNPKNPSEPKKADSDNDSDNDIINNNSFDRFWNLYDKKVGGKPCCEKIWKKLSNEEKSKVFETLPQWLKNITDKKFQPYPATYLNQRRWEDELFDKTKVAIEPPVDVEKQIEDWMKDNTNAHENDYMSFNIPKWRKFYIKWLKYQLFYNSSIPESVKNAKIEEFKADTNGK